MSQPSPATVKRLFAASRNACAFPKCTIPIVEPASGKVTGRICHIRARQPNGPRYDEQQSEDERHAFENLILLCPIHHDVVDADVESYTTERLLAIKAQHEAAGTAPEPSDAVVESLLVLSNVVSSGSVIASIGQTGGQLAHSITNIVIAPTPEVDLQPVIARRWDLSDISLRTLQVRLQNIGKRRPDDIRLRVRFPSRYLRHSHQTGQVASDRHFTVFERGNEFFVDQNIFQQLYPGEVTKQILQEVHYFLDPRDIKEADVAEISVRSSDAPEVNVTLPVRDLEQMKANVWHGVSRAGEIYPLA